MIKVPRVFSDLHIRQKKIKKNNYFLCGTHSLMTFGLRCWSLCNFYVIQFVILKAFNLTEIFVIMSVSSSSITSLQTDVYRNDKEVSFAKFCTADIWLTIWPLKNYYSQKKCFIRDFVPNGGEINFLLKIRNYPLKTSLNYNIN